MAEVQLPVVGAIPKKSLLIGGGAAAALIAFLYIRKRKAAPAAPGTTGTDTAGTDAAGTGDYADPGLQDTSMGPTYGSTGYYDPNSGQWVYGNTGTGQAAATTNAQWSQNAIAYLGQQGADTGALSAALGAYLAGQPLTADQVSLVDQAIAVEGYPPVAGANGYPPGIREGGTPSQGGTGGSGGGVTGSGSGSGTGTGGGPITVTPVALHTTQVSKNSAQVAWIAPTVPKGQGPLTGYGVAAYDSHGSLVNGPFTVGAGQLYANIGGLKSRTAYHVNVWCDPAKTGGPHATVSFTTK